MSPKNKDKNLTIKIKRGTLFCFCLVFFFFPGQNWYALIQADYHPSKTQSLNFSLPPAADYPFNFNDVSPPVLTAHSVAVIDRDSAVLMYGRNEKVQVLPASTVKLMTALVALDYYQLDDILVVGEVDNNGQDMELINGEKITVENLLYGLLVASANDAALALAQNYPGGEEGFVKAMNQKARQLSLNNSYFANPTGLDSDQEGNLLKDFSYTTALDLARLASFALKNETILKIVSTPFIKVTDVEGKIVHNLYSINELLNRLPGMKGMKTGWTEEAGECLIGYTEREGRGVITVVLGSYDRFGETRKLVDWVFDNFRWVGITPSI